MSELKDYALIVDNKVTEIFVWDGDTTVNWTPPTTGTVVVINETDGHVNIGTEYDGTKFIIPEKIEIDTRTTSYFYKKLRERRDNLLQISDWTQFSDSPLDSTKKAEWATYRQALRDLPSNVTDDNVKDVTDDRSHSSWPTKPS